MEELGIEVKSDGTVVHHKFGVEVLGLPLAQASLTLNPKTNNPNSDPNARTGLPL